MMIKAILCVFLGGGAGSVLRYLTGEAVRQLGLTEPIGRFPWATLAVNLIGSFLLGLLSTWIAREALSPYLRLLLVVGLCGGFTTFSTFSNEAVTMLRNGQTALCIAYVAVSIILGFALCAAGALLIKN